MGRFRNKEDATKAALAELVGCGNAGGGMAEVEIEAVGSEAAAMYVAIRRWWKEVVLHYSIYLLFLYEACMR